MEIRIRKEGGEGRGEVKREEVLQKGREGGIPTIPRGNGIDQLEK
jgi:hypothetical protein